LLPRSRTIHSPARGHLRNSRTPAYWGWEGGRYLFHPGYWGREVGFYGGIDYGFGYNGEGYFGGRWDHGAFFYNRTVNNITNVRITNIYNQTVVVNNTVNRVSFNGGNGGTAARPTPQQEAFAHEKHVEATTVQRQHAETASKDRSLFAKQNHGEPTVAAAPRAGVLQGEGVTHASRTPVAPAAPPAGRAQNCRVRDRSRRAQTRRVMSFRRAMNFRQVTNSPRLRRRRLSRVANRRKRRRSSRCDLRRQTASRRNSRHGLNQDPSQRLRSAAPRNGRRSRRKPRSASPRRRPRPNARPPRMRRHHRMWRRRPIRPRRIRTSTRKRGSNAFR
jgi:hypothetical protein